MYLKDLQKLRFEVELDLDLDEEAIKLIFNEDAFKFLPDILFDSEELEYIGSVFLFDQGVFASAVTSVLLVITQKGVFTVIKKPGLSPSINDIPFSKISALTGSGNNLGIQNIDGKSKIVVTFRNKSDVNKVRELLYDKIN